MAASSESYSKRTCVSPALQEARTKTVLTGWIGHRPVLRIRRVRSGGDEMHEVLHGKMLRH
jgi:hypothetical protein